MSLNDITAILGEYMLKGWVLTDKYCPTCATPLMRSPRAMSTEVWFCAKCDGGPPGHTPKSRTQNLSSANTTTTGSSPSSSTRKSVESTPSTPATEISTMSDEDSFTLPPETDESRRRREQSDRASAELGRRLLRGWAMLGDECPNSSCYGVPLMRPPNNGDQRSPQKECVNCGGLYTTETTSTGQQHLVQLDSTPAETKIAAPLPSGALLNGAQAQSSPTERPAMLRESGAIQAARHPNATALNLPNTNTLYNVLSETSSNLQLTLRGLSASLATAAPANLQSPESISRVANAISDVTQALRNVEQLRREQGFHQN